MAENDQRKISAFVISYNREELIETCLKSVRFADELIVVDKSSADSTVEIARRYADRVVVVPWSPTVEETRAYALSLCQHDIIVFLDDDEVLSVEAIDFIRQRARQPNFGVVSLPLRHYILGRHDETAYYWPERQIRAFERGKVSFGSKVHSGVQFVPDDIEQVGLDTGICCHNLSYKNTFDWIEKTNRYTSVPNRASEFRLGVDSKLDEYVSARLSFWSGRKKASTPYTDAVSVLRALYDVVDAVKIVEASIGVFPETDFAQLCSEFNDQLDAHSRVAGHRSPTLAVIETREDAAVRVACAPLERGQASGVEGLVQDRERLAATCAQQEILIARLRDSEVELERTIDAMKQALAEASRKQAKEFLGLPRAR